MITRYTVIIRNFAERHFIHEFEKKHKKAWNITWEACSIILANMDELLKTTKAEIIFSEGEKHIVKYEFAVAGRQESPHASGNRMIVFMNSQTHICEVLLVYGKGNIAGTHETAWWHNCIFDAYSDIRDILKRRK